MTTATAAYLPPELVEEILLNLPVKSLLRFTSVSKSWNSMIHGFHFVKRYRIHAMIVLKPNRSHGIPRDSSICPLSSNTPLREATPLVFPFKGGEPYLHASCDELWCVGLGHSLFLWNPSTRTYGKLPNPSLSPWPPRYRNQFSYGLGYDSTADDYKMLKIQRSGETELYSLKHNSWRNIKPYTRGEVDLHWNFSRVIMHFDSSIQIFEYKGFREYCLKMGVFVGGALHWIVFPDTDHRTLEQAALIFFDLSTEKYGEMGLPQFDRYDHVNDRFTVEMTALKGMLCLCVNYCSIRFVLWVMEGYAWTRKLEIDFQSYPCLGRRPMLRPFYLYDNGEFLIHVSNYMAFVSNFLGLEAGEGQNSEIFVCNKDEQTMVEKGFGRKRIIDSFVYVENLVSLTKLGKKKPLRFVDVICCLKFVWGAWLEDL